jgi:hypothetical protein
MNSNKKDRDSPGPGAYDGDSVKIKKKEPSFGFGTQSRLKSAGKRQFPDPATYHVKDDLMRKTGQSWGLGYGKKIDLAKTLSSGPGPGTYEFRSTVSDGRK